MAETLEIKEHAIGNAESKFGPAEDALGLSIHQIRPFRACFCGVQSIILAELIIFLLSTDLDSEFEHLQPALLIAIVAWEPAAHTSLFRKLCPPDTPVQTVTWQPPCYFRAVDLGGKRMRVQIFDGLACERYRWFELPP